MSLPNEKESRKRLHHNANDGAQAQLCGLTTDEFGTAADKLMLSGLHPIAIGKANRHKPDKPAGKAPWHSGVTGYNGVDASRDQVKDWAPNVESRIERGEHGVLNLGMRMPVGGIGLDVDAYDGKRGLKTIAEHESRLGQLPPTYRITARPYAEGSGIRLYRVPEDWHGATILKADDGRDGNVELIQRHHRLAAVPPSVHHTGKRYRLYDESTGQEVSGGVVPPLEDWQKLPDAWTEALRCAPAKAAGGEATDDQVQRFAAEHTRSEQPWHLTEYIVPSVRRPDRSTRNAAFMALHESARTTRLGWCSWADAAREIEAAARASYAERGEIFDPADFARSVSAAVCAANAESLPELETRYAKRLAAEDAKRRAVAGVDGWTPTIVNDTNVGGPITRSLAGVVPAKVEWLWRPWLPLGKVSILEGEPDVGKSALSLTLSAIVSTGGEWPDSVVDGDVVPGIAAEAAGVVLVGVEDDYADTVVPRLIAADADLDRIHTITQPLDARGAPSPFVIPDDVGRLRRAVVEARAKLVIIDPITAFLSTSQVKAGDDPSTRQALMPLVLLAAETGCAVVLVRHLNKATGMSAKNRGSGTIAFTGVTRSVLVAGRLKEETPNGPTHAIARTKGNLSKEPMAIGYRLDNAPDDPDSPVVTWCGPLDMTADQLVGADGAKVGDARKSAPVRDEATATLTELLTDGPMKADEATKKTREVVGCSVKTVKEAAKRLLVVRTPVRLDNKIDHWTWELPPDKFRLTDSRNGGDLDLETPEP
ncbi:AAA family ATPase [Mycobacterium avium]|uniref:AAA family ATPase n=1 Tax=Mycobacterium avium TaxID=1764 RepID=UPI000BAE81A1|nr:AAA family ATPase [Mycobacterium avium]PBA12765.1 hypothetical protein CKJ69_22285 [Mycobacterium avium]PBA89228.1 hypothetical protein CKJ60_22285 [Mycobacterium avium]